MGNEKKKKSNHSRLLHLMNIEYNNNFKDFFKNKPTNKQVQQGKGSGPSSSCVLASCVVSSTWSKKKKKKSYSSQERVRIDLDGRDNDRISPWFFCINFLPSPTQNKRLTAFVFVFFWFWATRTGKPKPARKCRHSIPWIRRWASNAPTVSN